MQTQTKTETIQITGKNIPLRVLWIGNNIGHIASISKGFDDYLHSADICKKAVHFLWPLGDIKATSEAKAAVSDMTFAGMKNLKDIDYIADLGHLISATYDIAIINLILRRKDIEDLAKEALTPLPSMALYNSIVHSMFLPICTPVLYTEYGVDGGYDMAWKKNYAFHFPHVKDHVQNLSIYDVAMLSEYDQNKAYFKHVMKDILHTP